MRNRLSNWWVLYICVIVSILHRANAQAPTPDGCFLKYCEKDISCARPYERRSGITSQECLRVCLALSDCQSVVYRPQGAECDMFRVTAVTNAGRRKRHPADVAVRQEALALSKGNGERFRQVPAAQPTTYNTANCGYRPATLVQCANADYYAFSGRCMRGSQTTPTPSTTTTTRLTTTTTAALPAGTTCPANQVARYIRLDDIELRAGDGSTFTARDIQECMDSCTQNRLPTGQRAPCRSFDFNEVTLTCAISMERLSPNGNGQANQNEDSQYFEKICIDAGVAQNCAQSFAQMPQKILVGFARSVVKTNNLQDCLNACLSAQQRFGFTCKSGMFYFNEGESNCILNSEDRASRPDLFTDETEDQVTYYETGCVAVEARVLAESVEADPAGVLMLDTPEWAVWSACDQSTKLRQRFRHCTTLNPKNCATQKEVCANGTLVVTTTTTTRTAAQSNVGGWPEGICAPLVKLDGTIDCGQAGVMFVGGQHLRCKPKECD